MQVPGGTTRREPLPVGFAANYGFSSGDARGEAPCIRKLKVSPFPPGRGLGGWGRQRQLTAGTAGDKEGKPPCKFRNGTVSRRPVGQAPRRASGSPLLPAPLGFSPGDARGEAPCIRKLKVSPFPPGRALCERGSGGWGRQSKLKAGTAGDKEGKPPCGHHSGKVSRRPVGQAPASDTATAGRAGNEKTPPLTPKETRFTLDRLPAFMYNYNEKGGSMARIPPPDTRFEQFVKIRICIDNHVTVCYNSDTAEEPRRNAP